MPLLGIETGDAPEKDELEVIVFGPGYGECICVHIGDGEWMVIDSCVIPGTSQPVALQYFEKIGISPDTAVQVIVSTHWHDDHCKGLASLLERCPNADFFLSEALTDKEFMKFVQAFQGRQVAASGSHVSEISRVFDMAVGGRKVQRATQGLNLYLTQTPARQIVALSPSAAAAHAFLVNVANAMPVPADQTKISPIKSINAAPNFSPNEASIALLVKVESDEILLGADLENESSHMDRGWNAVLQAKNLPTFKASTFKIPHHGSLTGYNNQVWGGLVNPNAISIITPWQRANKDLPQLEGLDALELHTKEIYLTAPPRSIKGASGKPSVVARELNDIGMTVTKIAPRFGAIRLRKKIGSTDPWNIACLGLSYKYQKAS